MNECLRCNEPQSETSSLCKSCQESLLNRSQEKKKEGETSPILAPEVWIHITGSPEEDQHDQHVLHSEQDMILDDPARRVAPTLAAPSYSGRHVKLKRLRICFIVLTVLAILALIVDSVLVWLVMTQLRSDRKAQENSYLAATKAPIMTTTTDSVTLGRSVQLHIRNAQPKAWLYIARNGQEPIQLGQDSFLVQAGTNGQADITMPLGNDWTAGLHSIYAIDIQTHKVAKTTLQVVGTGPILPPRLQISPTSVNLGTTSMQTVELKNIGESTLSWRATTHTPWLKVTPSHGMFTRRQNITIGVSRANLTPGDYKGTIIIRTDRGEASTIEVKMSVPASSTPLEITSPIFTFTASDGGVEPDRQHVQIHNSSSQPVRWSLDYDMPKLSTGQNIPYLFTKDWIKIEPIAGEIAPGETRAIALQIHSHIFLPGLYTGILKLKTELGASSNIQEIAISLDVRPPCGISPNMGKMSFVIAKHTNKKDSQRLRVSATAGCDAQDIKWQAFPLGIDWLTITPSQGRVREKSDMAATVNVNAEILSPGVYNGFVIFSTEQQTQAVAVHLAVRDRPEGATQPAGKSTVATALPSPAKSTPTATTKRPVLKVSPSELTFTVQQGIANSPSKSLQISNPGGETLQWNIDNETPSWLNITTNGATLASGQSEHISVSVDTTRLQPGSFDANIMITGTDSTGTPVQGSPQGILVRLKVEQSCSLQVTPAQREFSGAILKPPPPDQNVTIKEVGNCARLVTWQASADQSWITLSSTTGNDWGAGSVITISVDTTGKTGTYKGKITITAKDSDGKVVLESPQTVKVTLNIYIIGS